MCERRLKISHPGGMPQVASRAGSQGNASVQGQLATHRDLLLRHGFCSGCERSGAKCSGSRLACAHESSKAAHSIGAHMRA